MEHLLSTPGIDVNIQNKVSWSINDQVIMICMVRNTILYMDGDVKNKTIEQLLLSLHTKTGVHWYLLPFNPISNLCIMHVNVYTLVMSYMKGHVNDHVLHVYVYTVPTMLAELLYPHQDGCTPLHIAVMEGRAACIERLLSIPDIDVDIKTVVSQGPSNIEIRYTLL